MFLFNHLLIFLALVVMEVDLSLGEDAAPVEDRDVVGYEDVDFNTQSRTMECVDAGIHATHEGDHTAQVSSRSLFDRFFVI
jgi:hypothetical protein